MTEIDTSAEHAENAVFAIRREIHADGTSASEKRPDPKAKSPARWAYERLALYIRKFEESLDPVHEVGMGFVGGGKGVLKIEGLGYFDPDIVTFYGSDMNGAKTQIVQHVSQLNVTLTAREKKAGQEKARRIGFRLAEALETDDRTQPPDGDTPR